MSKKILFSSVDNTFCKLENCSKKNNCVRALIHYPQFVNHPRLSTLLINDEKECTIFSSITVVKYLEDIVGGDINDNYLK